MLKEILVHKVSKVHRDLEVTSVCKDLKVQSEHEVFRVLKETRDHKETKDLKVTKGLMVKYWEQMLK